MKNFILEKRLIWLIAIVAIFTVIAVSSFMVFYNYNELVVSTQAGLKMELSKRILQFDMWQTDMLAEFSLFTSSTTKNGDITKEEMQNALIDKKQALSNNTAICELYVGYEDNKDFFGAFGYTPGEEFVANERPWYKNAVDADGKISKIAYRDYQTNRYLISFSQQIRASQMEGVVSFDFWLRDIAGGLGAKSDKYYFIVDENNDILYHPEEEFMPLNGEVVNIKDVEAGKYIPLYDELLADDGNMVKIGKFSDAKFYAYDTIEGFNWKIVVVSGGHNIYKNNLIIGAVCVSMIILVLVLTIFSLRKANVIQRRFEERTLRNPIMIVLSIVLVFSVMAIVYVKTIKKTTEDELFKYMKEIANESAAVVRKQVEGDFKTLTAISTFIGNYYEVDDFSELDVDKIMEILQKEVDNHKFKRMILIDTDGSALTTDNYEYDFSYREYFEMALGGTTNISDTITDIIDQKRINVYATPIYSKDKIIGILSATNDNEIFSNLLSVSIFEGTGFSYIVKKNGDLVVRSNHIDSDRNFNNLFQTLEKLNIEHTCLDDIKADMVSDESGVIKYQEDNVYYYLAYEPVGINDWYICSAANSAVVTQKTDKLVTVSLYGAIAIVATLGSLLLYIVFSQNNSQKKLKSLAFVDQLTQFANFNRFEIDASNILAKRSDMKYALISIDIDKFKTINDIYGREKGDEILVDLANVINEYLSDSECFCRSISDCFYLLIKYIDQDSIIDRINSIENAMSDFELRSNVLISFGVYEIMEVSSISNMCDYAAIARKLIKGKYDINYAFYSDNIRNQIIKEKNIETAMYSALENGDFVMYLQPKYELSTEQIVGAEALVRWIKEDNKIIPPNDFIPLFEKNGFIIRLDYYIWEQSIKAISDWIKRGLNPVPISINVSRAHFVDFEFIDVLFLILQKYNIDKSYIELELTESAFSENPDSIFETVEKLTKMGFAKSIDDFGAGYSSLNLLRKIDVDVIKLDKEFLDSVSNEERGKVVLRNMVSMIRELNIKTVAEGVETLAHKELLTEIKCDMAQGYYYAKPMPLDQFEELLFGGEF